MTSHDGETTAPSIVRRLRELIGHSKKLAPIARLVEARLLKGRPPRPSATTSSSS